jgi:hypothetical protein
MLVEDYGPMRPVSTAGKKSEQLIYWSGPDVIQEKENPMSGRETILLELCAPESTMPLYFDIEKLKGWTICMYEEFSN